MNDFTITNDILVGYTGKAEKVIIPEGITCIAQGVFFNREEIREIILPHSLTVISTEAFKGCKNIVNIFIPENVRFIEWDAFLDCQNLQYFSVDKNNRYYYDDDGLLLTRRNKSIQTFPPARTDEKYIISDGVRSISRFAFVGHSNLKEIVFPESIENIGICAFMYCKALTSIILPKNVRDIESDAFYNCKKIREVFYYGDKKHVVLKLIKMFPRSHVVCFNYDCLQYIDKGIRLKLSLSYTYALEKGFTVDEYDKKKFLSYIKKQRMQYTHYYDFNRHPYLLRTMMKYKMLNSKDVNELLESISLDAELRSELIEYSNTAIKPVDEIKELEKQIKIAENLANNGVMPLNLARKYWRFIRTGDSIDLLLYVGDDENVVVPNMIGKTPVSSVSDYAFQYLNKLTTLFIHKDVEELGVGVCIGQNKLKKVTILDGMKIIERVSFAKCTNLQEVNLSNGLIKIEESVFYKCYSLNEIILPDSLEEIQKSAFEDCQNLQRVKLSANLKKLEVNAFAHCVKLQSITFPKYLRKIEDNAFFNCRSLTEIVFEGKDVQVSTNAFSRCYNIKSVKIPKDFNLKSLETIKQLPNLQSIITY